MDKDQTLHLVVVEESRNDAEALANVLRNAGHILRLVHVEDAEDLEQALAQHPDLVLCATGLESMSLEQTAETLAQHAPGVPLVAVGEATDASTVVNALRTGAADLVAFDYPEHLQLVVARELQAVACHRKLKRYEASFQESEKRCRTLLDSSRDAIAYVHEGMHIYANRSYLEMFGFDDPEEIEGTPIMDMVAPDDHGKFKEFLRSYAKATADDHKLEIRGLRPEGSHFNVIMEFTDATVEGEPCTQIVLRDQSDSKALEQKLKYLSKQDLVTGLYNRQYFMEELQLAVTDAQSGSGSSAMLYIALDNFKSIKETVGIAGSDLVISDVAQLLKDQMGEQNIAARFGDNAFTVLIREQSMETAQSMADALRHSVEEQIIDVEGRSIALTCSVGISAITESAPGAQEILSRADLACEVARSAGGNRTHMHNPVVDEQLGKERDQQWNQLIQDALSEGRFRLVYQPIVSLQGDSNEKYEVLLRMRDSQGEDIMPGQFISVAEQTGQIATIDRWVVEQAVEMLSERRRQGVDTTFFIKVSQPTIEDPNFPVWVNQQLQQARLAGDAITFEFAEQTAVEQLKSAKAFVKAMESLHCGTALEHFGKGPNSFQLLKHLPVSYLKIDGSFIHNLATNADNQAVVKSIVETARSLNKPVIAEFVEDASSLSVLWQHGVQYIQGYFLQEPDAELAYDFSEETV
ncbi:MAG: EAL domain-containing protein [Gammaproteobacteria bacterium]